MNTVAIYIPCGENADVVLVEVHTAFGHVGGSLSRDPSGLPYHPGPTDVSRSNNAS